MRELFVYYRIRQGAAAGARAAVAAMHEELRARHPGLVARLLTRSDEGGATTWMETYALSPHGLDVAAEDTIARCATRMIDFIDGARHVEAFDSEA